MRQFTCGMTALVAIALGSGASAQPASTTSPAQALPATTSSGSYDATFWSRFGPRSALDIVRQLPGFSLQEGDNEVRGLAGTAGNVVINGARPSSKAESLETQLSRIPVSRVSRILVGPGDAYGADYASRPQVANIILTSAGGLDVTFNGEIERNFSGDLLVDGDASILWKQGSSSLTLSAARGLDGGTEEGSDTLTDIATNSRQEFRRKINTYRERDPYLSANWSLEQSPREALRLNARWSPASFDLTQRNRVTPRDGPQRDDRLVQAYRTDIVEFGGDVTRPLAGGALKFVGLRNQRERRTSDTYSFRSLGGQSILGGFRQEADLSSRETVGRLSWSRPSLFGFSVEASGEMALNSLIADSSLFSVAAGGAESRIDLPIDQASVRERRGQLSLSLGRQLSDRLRIDAVAAWETSRLKVRGDTRADRSLSFFKPAVTIDWKGPEGWHVQAVARRTVAQLDFFDFISSAELSNDRINGGNADLEPQRAWEARLLIERPILGEGQVRLTLGHDRVQRLQDRILTDAGFDAPGNLGTGKRSFAQLEVDAPLDRIGAKGVRAKLSGTVQKSQVLDPASGETRAFSGFFPRWQWNAELRRDVGAWAYGGTLNGRAPFSIFRTDQVDTNRNLGLYGTAFVEHRPGPGTTVTLSLDNATNIAAETSRAIYRPNRRDGVFSLRETRERNRHIVINLAVKQTLDFGNG